MGDRSRVALGVDVGGTALKAGVVDPAGRVTLRRECRSAVHSGQEIEDDIVRLIGLCAPEAARGSEALPLGVCLPGMLSADGERVERAANLPGLVGYPLPANLRRRHAGAVTVLADSDAAAVAEARCGAGRGAARLLVASIGTGIGVSLVEEGRLIAETERVRGLGHLVVDPQGPVCACGQRGCVEALAAAVVLRRELCAATGRDLSHDELRECVAQPGEACAAVVMRWSAALALGITMWAGRLAPTHIVLAGGITAYGEALLDRVRAVLARAAAATGQTLNVPVEFSTLGRDAALIGAGLAALGA